MNEKIFALIVVYNKELENSITCNFLLNISIFKDKLTPIIIDNSTINTHNQTFCIDNNITYYNMNGNVGLSKAYNYALNHIGYKYNDIIILLDDDTEITDQYFEVLFKSLLENPNVDIFSPCIKGQDGNYYSPNEYSILKCHQMRSIDSVIRDNKFNAINSCTAIRAYVFDSFRYNEKMFLDQIDHYFFRYQREQGRKFYKMPIEIKQNFFLDKKNKDYRKVWNRYKILIHDFKILTSHRGFFEKSVGFIKVIGWGIRGIYRYRSLKFLFLCILEYYKSDIYKELN